MDLLLAQRTHCKNSIRARLKRNAIPRDIGNMARALRTPGHTDCFMRRVYPNCIKGVVRYQNIFTGAVLDTNTGNVVTVGVSLARRDTKKFKESNPS